MSDFYTLDNESTPPSYPTTKIGQTAIQRVRELHHPTTVGQRQVCSECVDPEGNMAAYPCPTIQALEGEA